MFRKIVLFTAAVIAAGDSARASTFNNTQNLSFGTLIPTATSGSVTIATSGAITTNGVVTIAPSGANYNSAICVFTGSGLGILGDALSMTFLSSSVTLSNGAGGTVTASNFTITSPLSVSILNPTVTAYIGGTMNFNASSTPGSYTGSVQVQGTGLLSGSATCTIPIILTLWKPISISKTADLAFGGIQPAAAAAVVRVAPQTGTRTLTSGAATLVSGQPAVAGQFTVTGRASTSISITLPTSTTITNAGGATMTVNNFTRYPAGTTTLDASGNLSLYVGADLNVAANQATGKYSGTYTITVNY